MKGGLYMPVVIPYDKRLQLNLVRRCLPSFMQK